MQVRNLFGSDIGEGKKPIVTMEADGITALTS